MHLPRHNCDSHKPELNKYIYELGLGGGDRVREVAIFPLFISNILFFNVQSFVNFQHQVSP